MSHIVAGTLWGSVILLLMLISMMLQLAGAMKLAGIEVNAGEQYPQRHGHTCCCS
jgi:hypothetical protein